MDYDIVIAGTGPAGLSVAKELSKNFKVLLIGRHTPPYTTCSWYSYEDRVKKYHLEKAVINRCDGLLYVAGNEKHFMKDKCVILDPKKILELWFDEFKGTFKSAELKNYSRIKDGLKIITTRGNFTCRLLVDCTGYKSPILKKHKLISNYNSWVLYGSRIKANIKDTKKILFLPLGDKKNTYLGVYPFSKNVADAYAFYNLQDKAGKVTDAKSLFKQCLKKYYPDARLIKPIGGHIISGELKKYALDNIVFFGESGMMAPPGIGMGFNEALLKHNKFCSGIKSLMNKKDLSEKSLQDLSRSLFDPAIFQLQQIITKFTYYFIKHPRKWEAGVAWLNALGPGSRQWMRGEIDIEWIENATKKIYHIIPLKETAKMMPVKDYLYVVEHFVKFLGEAIYEEAEKANKKYKRELIRN